MVPLALRTRDTGGAGSASKTADMSGVTHAITSSDLRAGVEADQWSVLESITKTTSAVSIFLIRKGLYVWTHLVQCTFDVSPVTAIHQSHPLMQ